MDVFSLPRRGNVATSAASGVFGRGAVILPRTSFGGRISRQLPSWLDAQRHILKILDID
jgi:hypothetical protein